MRGHYRWRHRLWRGGCQRCCSPTLLQREWVSAAPRMFLSNFGPVPDQPTSRVVFPIFYELQRKSSMRLRRNPHLDLRPRRLHAGPRAPPRILRWWMTVIVACSCSGGGADLSDAGRAEMSVNEPSSSLPGAVTTCTSTGETCPLGNIGDGVLRKQEICSFGEATIGALKRGCYPAGVRRKPGEHGGGLLCCP